MAIKEVWTNDDFQDMGWHDCRLYAVKFPQEALELTLDIDYIFKWEKLKNDRFRFLVAPCNLTFQGVLSLKLDLKITAAIGVDILAINRSLHELTPNKRSIWHYAIETDRGLIEFETIGFVQKIRSQPIWSSSQNHPSRINNPN